MKKLLTLFLALLMLLTLVACQGGEGDEETTPKPADTTLEPDEETTTAKETTAKETTAKETTTAVETTTEPPVEIPVVPEGLMVFFEDFDSYVNTEGNDAVMALIGWKIRNISDGALTDNTGVFSIENGALKYINYNDGAIEGKDSYVLIRDSDYMAPCAQGSYTVQYDVKYIGSKNSERYAVIILNYDGYNSYNSAHIRIAGSGNNQVRFFGTWSHYESPGEYYAADKTDGDGSSSIIYKLTGANYDSTVYALKDKWLSIRYQASYNEGPTVYIRDNSQAGADFVCVSKADSNAAGFLYWGEIESYAVALKLGATIDGYLDNVAIWTGLGDMPTDKSTGAYEAAIAAYLAEVQKQ